MVGYGHRPITWPVQPTVAALDEVAPDVPVVLVSGDAHHGWLNSRALDRARRWPRATACCVEGEWYAAYARIAEIAGDETSPDAYLRWSGPPRRKGVVGVVELEYGEGARGVARALGAGVDLLRVRRGVYPDGLDAVDRGRPAHRRPAGRGSATC